jgi:glycosyltransferase involved in cell wall biosynthesis
LISENCIREQYLCAKRSIKNIVFPEYLISFGEENSITRYSAGSFLTPADFLYQHSFVSRSFCHRSVFFKHKYSDLNLASGFSYEDWHFNSLLFAEGYMLVVALNTLLFYRRKTKGLLNLASSLSAGIIAHSELFKPNTFIKLTENIKPDLFSSRVTERTKALSITGLISSSYLSGMVKKVSELDSGIKIAELARNNLVFSSIPADYHWGYSYLKICRLLGDQPFSDIVLINELNPGGGERYILDILTCISKIDPNSRFLILIGEKADKHLWNTKDRIPDNSVVLDIPKLLSEHSIDKQDLLVIRTLLAVAGVNARLHLKCSIFSHRIFNLYHACLKDFKVVYYRFGDPVEVVNGDFYTEGYSFDFISNHLDQLWRIISDNTQQIDKDIALFGICKDKFKVLYAKQDTACSSSLGKKKELNRKLLWASRLGFQKRPVILRRIAVDCSQLFRGFKIHAFGVVPSFYADQFKVLFPKILKSLSHDGEYLSFKDLNPEKYDAFIYTSYYDGLPNVILEAMSYGMPVIAPNIAGIPEVIRHLDTGFLVESKSNEVEMALGYVEAIKQLYSNWRESLDVGKRAKELIASKFDEETYRSNVKDIFFC